MDTTLPRRAANSAPAESAGAATSAESTEPDAPSPQRIAALAAVAALAALAGLAVPLPCHAQHSLAIQGGRHTGVESVGVQWTLPPWFRAEPGGWRITGSPEVQVSRQAHEGDEMVQGGVFANFRFEPPVQRLRPYLELGVGLNVFSRSELGSKEFATRFQFGELAGIGVAWGGRPGGYGETWVGARVMHFSNAGIRRPNPGLETFQLVIGHRF